jgi:hypothetical protein
LPQFPVSRQRVPVSSAATARIPGDAQIALPVAVLPGLPMDPLLTDFFTEYAADRFFCGDFFAFDEEDYAAIVA